MPLSDITGWTFPQTDSDAVLDPEVDYTCVGIFRDDILAAYNEDYPDDEPFELDFADAG